MKQAYPWEVTSRNTVEFGTEADYFTVKLGPESGMLDPAAHELTSGTYGFSDVAISGLWHVSKREIAAFRNDRITGVASKRGPGTYVGAGHLGGTNLATARMQPHVTHEVVARGNYLVLPLEDAFDVSFSLLDNLEMSKEEEATIIRMNTGHRLNKILRNHRLGGVVYDGFIEYANESEPFIAEGVIFKPEDTLEITHRRHIVPQ